MATLTPILIHMSNTNSKPSNEIPVKGVPFYCDETRRYILLTPEQAQSRALSQGRLGL